ncbi:amino acid adenylation domain-containing protein [Nannocystis exedens]|uniref:Amino acid adenylation domain-containing protein n=2 Tax=Nannocystis exedens TaxID=54 RepID=A0A1I2E0N8_9BACT|nr:hybrid non-ribosomal peptide synthase/polyketide synthase [Nannocystis exedens]SFE86454.1 amino acid adenylation domain-containing protein [Nannocystis exedens]
MWLLARLHGSVPAFHERGGAWLDGDVDASRLGDAVAQIVARHEVLRTTIGERDGRPAQLVWPAAEVTLRQVALGTDLQPASDGDALAAAADEAALPFDLERGPLFRATLFTLHGRRHLLVVVMHHLISDGDASLELFFAELFAGYHGGALPRREAQYRDHARTQLTAEARARAEAQLEYWAEELAGAPAALALATDRPRPAVQTFTGAGEARVLDGELTRALVGFAAAADTDLYVLLLAGLQAVLHRHSRQDDILVGAPLAGRDDPRFARAIGYFGNPVVFRGRFAGDPAFHEVVRQLHRTVQDGRRHGDVSFKSVVERLAPARDPSRTPLFQVLFHVRPPAAAPRKRAGVTLTPVDVDLRHVAYDLVVTAQPLAGGDGLALRIEYNRDLFDPAAAAGLLAQWEVLLRGALEDPDAPVSRQPLLPRGERRRVLRALDARDAPAPRGPACLHARVEAHARRDPAAPAVRFADRRLTYGELDRRSNQVAHLLRRRGVGPDVLVGVCMERSVDMIVAMLAVLKAGGAYVPFDPTHPAPRLAFMLADSGVSVLLATSDCIDWLPEPGVEVVAFDADRDRLAAEPEHAVAPLAGEGPDNLAYAIYTSGSTGQPKGACVTHRNVINLLVDTDYLQIDPSDRVAQTANASFDAATMEIWSALLHGAELVGVARETALEPTRLARAIAEESFGFMLLTPALFAAVARAVPGAFAPLKTLVCGGDVLDPEAVRRVLEGGPPRHLINGYGPTEATVCATWCRVADAPAAGAAIPIGRPIARVAVYVLDAHREPVPPGVCGEIWIAGAGVGRGYHRRPELTAERFLRDPFAPGGDARMYRTGDLGRLRHDGRLEFHGRIDQQLKIRGFRVELGEIEAALAEQPGVRQAAVIAVEVAGDRRLVAYVAADGSDDAIARTLRGALAQRLPEYMVPAEFVVLDALPYTPNGKLDRAALPALDARRLAAGREFVAPRSELEESLADIWRELLGQPQVGVHDDFFALGGHSLHAVQLFSRLRAVFGVEVRFQEFFGRSTVAELAVLMRRARSAPNVEGAIARAPRDRPLPLSFGQERLWFLNRFAPQSRAYNCMYAYRLTGALDVAAIDRSLRALVERHEILRTTYAEIDGRPVQRVDEEGSFRLAVTDLQHLAPAEREAEVRAQLDAEAQRLFDLERGPLFRAGLLRLGPEDQVLWLHFHHLTMDGWSTELAFREVAALYAEFSQGVPAGLPALTVQYADFAAWQRERATDDATAPLLGFWKQALHGAPPLLDLPGDRPRPPVQSFEGAAVTFELPPALTRALRDLGGRQGMTLTMTLLAAYAALLHRHARVDDLVIGMPSANRDRVELERTMGFFVNTLAIRVDLAGDPTVAELLERVRQVCLAAYDHDALPFERLVHELRPARDAGYNPVVQVAFAPQPPAGRSLQLRGLTSQHLAADARKAIFDLSFYSWESAGGVAGIFEYSTDRFERATIERMVGHLTALLAAMAADPARRVSALPMLTGDERRLVATWGAGPAVDADARTALDLFEAQAARTPDALAVTAGARSLTYRQLDRRANHLAHRLRALGVAADTRVGVCMERSPELLVALLAAWKAGAAYVPLDPEGGAERLAHILADAGAPVLLAGPRVELPGYAGRVLRLADDLEGADAAPPRRTGPGDLAYVVYTSGSTGRPKGVLVEHRGLANLVAWHTRRFEVGPAARATLVASPGFDASVWEIWPYLCNGASLAVPAATLRLSPEDLRDWLIGQAITISFQPTAIAEELLRLQWPARCALRVLLTGGDRLRGRPGPGLPFALVNNYGPTEATVVTTSGLVAPLAPGEVAREPALGRPIAGARVLVLDAHGQAVPAGVPGELHIGGVGVARGYLGRPDLTAERFIPDPSAPGARLYRSGDLVRWRDGGELEFLGRLDEQVKIRGVRIEPGEIEAALREHPAVRDVAVVATEDGPATRRLVAYFTRAEVDADPAGDAHEEHVSAWRALYDETYGRERTAVPGFDIVGWNSSYTGAAYDPAVMRTWRDRTVERLLAFRPARVWEIGCGTGLLLLPLAPACATYLGTDFSQRALDAIAPALTPALAHVTLQRREADDFAGVAADSVDLVVLNSIAQYFPHEAYLRRVLVGAVRSVAAGGVVFVGDVRSLPLLAAFRTSVERARANADTPAAAIAERVRRAVAHDEELCVDPAYFFTVGDDLPRVGHVEVWLKRGRGDDEMTRYRYDAALFVGEPPPAVEPACTLAWTDLDDLAALERRLAARDVGSLELLGVPNARVADDARAAAALQEPAPVGETFAALLARTRRPAIEPEALWELGERHGWAVRITWSQGHGPAAMDVLFEADADPQRPRAWHRARPSAARPRESLVHEPPRTRQLGDLAPALRRHLAGRLHEAMIPAAFVQLDALPRTPHGKLDRRALPAPATPQRAEAPASATTDVEATLAAIWRRLLGLDEVGLDDPFFELGGHSLLLAQVRAAIRTQLGRDVPIVELFQHPTIRSLAAHLRGAAEAPARPEAPARREHADDAVAIVGMAGRFPGAADVAAFWANLRAGVESITVADEATLRALGVAATPGLVPASGVLDDAFAFDAELFATSPGDAALMDPQHRVFLECAWAALEHAGHRPTGHPGAVGVFAGCDAPNYWMERIGFRGGPLASEYYRVAGANMADGLTTRTAYKLGLRGPALTVLSACSTSLVAVHLACRSLLAGECELALAGGAAIHPPSRVGHVHEEGSLVSPDGHCRPFDADAAGTVNGSGVAVVVLRRLADALAEGDTIHAVIRGSAVGNDGARKVGYTAPGVDGQAETIARALAAADVDPASVGYVEAHGTGTRLGDPIEVAALTRVFRRHTDAVGVTALGSVKGNVGHLGAAAGVTGLIKATLALQHELVPPTLHFRRPNPELALEQSPFFVPASPLPWPRQATPRRAGVSAFGVGGTNAHVVLEEAPTRTSSTSSRRCQLLTLSARTEAALATSAERLSVHLQATPGLNLADVAHTLRVGRMAMAHRRVLVTKDGRVGFTADGVAAAAPPPVVFMFPGGGSQQLDMGRELYRSEPVYRAALDRCADAFQAELGLDIRALLFPPGDARAAAAEQMLRPRENLAVIFSTEVALAELLQSWAIRPAAVTGHSLGEYAAAHVAGVLSLAGAAALIAERGRIYEALPPDAETLIVRISEAELTPRLGADISLAAVNGPEVCVVSGTRQALRDLEAALVREGRDVTRLAIATAAHSSLVEPFLGRMHERAAALTFEAPRIPIISNLTGRFMTAEEARDPGYWARHLRGTVRFADGLTTLLADPSRVFIEVGPGVTLTKLASRHPHAAARGERIAAPIAGIASNASLDMSDSTRHSQHVFSTIFSGERLVVPTMAQPGVFDDDAEALLAAVGRLWCAGVELDGAALAAGEARKRVPLPTYPFARTRHVYAGPRADGAPPSDRRLALDLARAADELAPRLRRLRDAARVTDDDAALVADLDRVCASQLYAYLFHGTDGRTSFHRDELLARLGVTAKFTRCADFFLRSLEQEGALRRDGDAIELLPGARELAEPDVLARRFAARHPDAAPLLALAEHCGAHYGPALRGEIDNTAVLHPDGSYALVRPAEELLLRTSHPEVYIRMVRDLVLRAVRSAGGAPLRILEFGGGQGRLTWELAPLLDGLDVEYWFTDISRYFTLKAEERAREEALDFMRFSRLDLDEDPIHQGYPRGYFDIILGLDALHVARDLAHSLAGLRHVLHENGLLVAVEVTRLATWHTALWGLEEGWWSSTDTDLRPDSPVLPAAGWQALFAAQGFRCARVLPEEEDERAATDHVLIAAQAHPAGLAPTLGHPAELRPGTRASAPGRAATPPRSDQERAIAALWQQALGLPCEDVHANFFALGGDSLIAVGLLTRLRAAFAVRFDSHALLERPTIAQLSEWIDEQRRAAAGPQVEVAPADNLVQLRGGGTAQPLFLVHAVGGHVYSYAELAGHLQLDQAVFGLRAFAAEERKARAGSIEAIARAYLERLRAVQPEGPYRIAGWSFGGAVAFEIASQLRAAGQSVLPLLIDSPAPTHFRDVAAAVEARAFRVFSAELGGAELDPAETAALEALPPEARISALFARIQQSHAAPDIVDVRQLEELLMLLSDNIRIWCRYEPRPYPGPLLQFRARDPASFLVERERALTGALGWEPYAAGTEAHEIPGDHFSIMKGDNVARLAAAMRPYLQR